MPEIHHRQNYKANNSENTFMFVNINKRLIICKEFLQIIEIDGCHHRKISKWHEDVRRWNASGQ